MSTAGVRANGGGCAATDHIGVPVPRARYGAAPPASRLLRIAGATALRAGPDPGDRCGPSARKHGQARPAPRTARGTPQVPRSLRKITTTKSPRFQGIAMAAMATARGMAAMAVATGTSAADTAGALATAASDPTARTSAALRKQPEPSLRDHARRSGTLSWDDARATTARPPSGSRTRS
jgi:hypothetical protein